MPIRKKDGTIYKVQGPNKIMIQQNIWDGDERVQVHNFDNYSIKEEPLNVPAVVEHKPPEATDVTKSQYRKNKRVMLYCLPAVIENFKDPLYEEERQSISFGDKFHVEVTIVQAQEFALAIWTTVTDITLMSILFNPEVRNWWRVNKIITDVTGDGIVLSCSPSDIKPDFS